MRIVILGINSFGQRVHDWLVDLGENVVALLTTKEDLERVPELRPDLIISGGFRHILREETLSIPPQGCINFHKSMLPYNRGANPNVWTILEGTTAGVSIHLMDKGIDTGPILAQREVETGFNDNARTLYEKLEQAQWELFLDFWPEYRAGNIEPKPQPHRGTFHQIADFKSIRRINAEDTYRAIDLLNLLRAMTYPPFNNAYVELDGRRYYLKLDVLEADAEADETTFDTTTMVRNYGE